MHKYRVPSGPPPWWPQDEPWPPYRGHRSQHWLDMRKKLRHRIRIIFSIIFISSITLLVIMINGLVHHRLPPGIQSVLSATPLVFRVVTWLLFAGMIFGLVYVGSTIRKAAIPISRILDAAGKITEGDYSARIPVYGHGEMAALSRAFNEMSARLELNDRQRRALLADISHELRTPLTVIQGNLEGMLDGIYPADETNLQAVLDETHTLARIIEDLRTLTVVESGALKLQLERANPGEFLEEIIPMYRALAEARNVSFEMRIDEHLPDIELDTTRIREVLANLVTNALRYCQAGGAINVRVEKTGDEFVQFSVQDNGAGIPAQDLPHIFERFYKDRDSSGSGLGLPIAKSLVEAHGGSMHAESVQGQGTVIRFTLPVAAE